MHKPGRITAIRSTGVLSLIIAEPGQEKVKGDSGVASRQMETTKYIEFRYVTTSSFTRNFCFLHKAPFFSSAYPIQYR